MANTKRARRVAAFGFSRGAPGLKGGITGSAPWSGSPGFRTRGCAIRAPSTRDRKALSNSTSSDSGKYRGDAPDQERKPSNHLRRKTISGTRAGPFRDAAQRIVQLTETAAQNTRPAAELSDKGAWSKTNSGAARATPYTQA